MTNANITLTQERLKELVHYDPETGVFTALVARGGKISAGDILGSDCNGYIVICINYRKFYIHRLAWLYMTGEWPFEIDHDNNDKSDNRWSNLFNRPHKQNARNFPARKQSKSGIFGVYWVSNRSNWVARIGGGREKGHLYYGPDFFEACCARKSAEAELGYHRNHGR